jgi:hypothetical protein
VPAGARLMLAGVKILLELAWTFKWVILFAAVVAIAGVQSYRLRDMRADRDLLQLEKTERARRDAMRDMANVKNKERTDEETRAARGRAAAVVVRGEPGKGVVAGPGIRLAAGGDAAAQCVDRGRLDEELAGWVEWHAAGLNQLLARISRRGDEAFTRSAREGEELAAAYRGCRVFTLNRQ